MNEYNFEEFTTRPRRNTPKHPPHPDSRTDPKLKAVRQGRVWARTKKHVNGKHKKVHTD